MRESADSEQPTFAVIHRKQLCMDQPLSRNQHYDLRTFFDFLDIVFEAIISSTKSIVLQVQLDKR